MHWQRGHTDTYLEEEDNNNNNNNNVYLTTHSTHFKLTVISASETF